MISGQTRLAGVIGDPVRHSLSPVLHNAAFAATGLDWVYAAFPVAAGRGADAVAAMRTLGIGGLSVTMPHKADVAAACDDLTPTARLLGSCNTLFRPDDHPDAPIIGHSTDGDGFVRAFEIDFGQSPKGLRFLVVGAGGSARSVVEALGRAGVAEVAVLNRTRSKADAMVELAPELVTVVDPNAPGGGLADAVAAADVVVNTTAVGMAGGPDPDGLPVPVDPLEHRHLVVDIVYQPRMTSLLVEARRRGASTANGLGMLAGQAAEQFVLWTGVPAPFEVMRQSLDGR